MDNAITYCSFTSANESIEFPLVSLERSITICRVSNGMDVGGKTGFNVE
ncbi:MAG: hypothetical protein Lokiarch_18710 [Candidatus Lokiarchaeum sp. GC14_75]|nr:MAG: hypothetical protein Lokiarch_18710 [Candidatus Lokiarchaeum sp. GC14_75]